MLAVIATLAMAAVPAISAASTWDEGDVFAGVGDGSYNVFDNSGVFKETISDGVGGFTTGCAFRPGGGDLYTTNFSNALVPTYDVTHPHAVDTSIEAGANGGAGTESVVFDGSGNFYVGNADGDADVQKYDASDSFVTKFDVATEDRGSDWIDLASDQETLFYTSEGFTVFRYDVSTGTQLADFATLPDRPAYALRLLPPGDGSGGLLVADTVDVKRLDATGAVVDTYDVVGENDWFALNLDPNGTSFWSGSFDTNNFYRFNIATGAVEVGPIPSGGSLFGLCVKGEATAAVEDCDNGIDDDGDGFVDGDDPDCDVTPVENCDNGIDDDGDGLVDGDDPDCDEDGGTTCFNMPETGPPTNGDDVLVGTSGPEYINGLEGDDRICGLPGDDILQGNAGADRVRGGNGEDEVAGEAHNDILYGGLEGDVMRGAGGNDYVNGQNGADLVQGGRGNDELFGGSGPDRIRGAGGFDICTGNAGVDTFQGCEVVTDGPT